MTLALKPQEKKLLKDISSFAKNKKIKLYLVGGYLRDSILERKKTNPDIDFCIKKEAINFGRKLQKRIGAGFVVLDKEHGCCRLVKRMDGRVYTLDFTDFRGKTLEEDLKYRDFTINALALELEKIFTRPNLNHSLIDPYRARKDLKSGLIRITNKKSFDDDPLRILRAFSLAAIFAFKIDKETMKLIRLKKKKLSGVSFERIRDELFKILDSSCAYEYLAALDKLKILKIIIPEAEPMRGVNQGPYHHLDVLKHSLETVRQIELIIEGFKKNREIHAYLNEIISGERKRRSLMKLGAFLHDIGKPRALRRKAGKTIFHGHERIGAELADNIARRLRLSNDESKTLGKMVFWHLRPGYLADVEEVTPRAKFRYFRDTAGEAVSTLLISLADQRSTKGPLTTKASRLRHEKIVLTLIKEYFREKKKRKLPRLITGDDLIRKFKLQPSPLIGKILSEIEELQAIGKIKTKKQALERAGKLKGGGR
ncbi:MAG: HD domain-containing protein [Candidatus Omnitrophota bacterium]|jgi:putative nucleotidyltransferase with HDIG domain